jgi:hypothetical protein
MPGYKVLKDRPILLLGGNAVGDCKIVLLLAYHSENLTAFKIIAKALLPVGWKSNPKAWIV